MLVVAAAIRDSAGRLLLQRALPGKPHQGLWEFPGGKVEAGESPRLALCRELSEELGLTLDEMALTAVGVAEEPGSAGRPTIVIILYDCPQWQGPPRALEHQEWDWFTPGEAAEMPLPRIDRTLLESLAR